MENEYLDENFEKDDFTTIEALLASKKANAVYKKEIPKHETSSLPRVRAETPLSSQP